MLWSVEEEISSSSFDIAFLSLLRANAVIIATGVLHNICQLNSIPDVPPEVEILTAEVVPVPNTAVEPGFTERATLISIFFNNFINYKGNFKFVSRKKNHLSATYKT